jgi:hypothetical protein
MFFILLFSTTKDKKIFSTKWPSLSSAFYALKGHSVFIDKKTFNRVFTGGKMDQFKCGLCDYFYLPEEGDLDVLRIDQRGQAFSSSLPSPLAVS